MTPTHGTPPTVLTIAGSDSGGGAGVQADLKTIAAHGAHGASALTAVTAQNTVGVTGVQVLDPVFVRAQIDAVAADLTVAATKTGMLASAAIISAVAAAARDGLLPNLVVDPVMVASSGDRLLDEGAQQTYAAELFPHACLITPNLAEAAALLGRELPDLASARRAAADLVAEGANAVLVKGGHLAGERSVDVLATGAGIVELDGPRVSTPNVHGTGCSLSSAIAARLALGHELDLAVRGAKRWLTRALQHGASWRLGAGRGPVNHMWHAERAIEPGEA